MHNWRRQSETNKKAFLLSCQLWKTAKLWSTFKKWQNSRNCHFLDKRFLMWILKFWNNLWDEKKCLFLSNEIFLQAGSYFTWKNKLEPFTFLNLLFFSSLKMVYPFLVPLLCVQQRCIDGRKGFLKWSSFIIVEL